MYLFEMVERVPNITDRQIEEMRHIHPVLRKPDIYCYYYKMKDANLLDPRNVSFLWNAQPEGEVFYFSALTDTTIITQHHSSVFFKPSLAEVYAWIRFYLGENWNEVKYFCIGDYERIGSSCDMYAKCTIFSGEPQYIGK